MANKTGVCLKCLGKREIVIDSCGGPLRITCFVCKGTGKAVAVVTQLELKPNGRYY